MKSMNIGPKVLLQQNQVRQQDDDEDFPDEPSPILIKQKIIKVMKQNQPRFDVKGRQIFKGTGYGIAFDNFVTVCVFNPDEEVLSIKDTISQCTNTQEQEKFHIKSSSNKKIEDYQKEIILKSILKQTKPYQ
ncbi:unnamed protein product (macronuclear) [Paramecium tetraurelia]|uniref:Uncharacterized protein n=1 Tax=Paramecium tetraurelia TaxID=5888 RepID=A0BLV9_PARTE|nr:uncharacterized protein GSPATT00030160001 [Paramecium tetraurelia]CAK59526.1 unnamed protein product [Paramecium tetraurelia]|eukprot:XP_001426924.1 hypothetical protein (macronuclear) [Paramecium tetraurelia strain d4-2]